MTLWGRGMFQCDCDFKIANWLSELVGYDIMCPSDDKRSFVIKQLELGDLAALDTRIATDQSLDPAWTHTTWLVTPPTRSEPKNLRERCRVVLLLLAMQLGVRMDPRLLSERRDLHLSLTNLIQELQFLTAANLYKNDGTPWIIGSKSYNDTLLARSYKGRGKWEFDCGDELWFSGLRHSADEKPFPVTQSVKCHLCHDELPPEGTVMCDTCHTARWCSESCRSKAIGTGKHWAVCLPGKTRYVSHVPKVADLRPHEPERMFFMDAIYDTSYNQ